MEQRHINKNKERLLTQQKVQYLLQYDAVTGKLYWKNPIRSYMKGNEAGSFSRGYRQVVVYGKAYMVHRLIWFYCYGEWPPNTLAFKDGDRQNTRLENLVPSNRIGKNGCVGIYYDNRDKVWKADISVHGYSYHLGQFKEKADAIEARKAGEKKYLPINAGD